MRISKGILITMLIIACFTLPSTMQVLAPSTPKTVYGLVDPNTTTTVIAYPGNSTFYLRDWRENGTDTGPMVTSGGVEYFNMDIEDNITNWEVGDVGVVIVDVETGSYLTGDRAGFVAYTTKILTDSDDIFPTVELQKIPIPIFVGNDTGFINISWTPLPDPDGLIAGYKIYRSPTNASDDWVEVGGISSPITESYFNDTTVTGNVTFYYSIKIWFVGFENNGAVVNNHENMYYGEGSSPMSSPLSIYTLNYINLTTGAAPDGPLLNGDILNVGDQLRIWASGYNDSINPNPYVDPVVVTWTHSGPDLGGFDTSSGTNTLYTAGYYHMGGTDTVTGDDGGTLMDTGDIIVNPPIIDYINLTVAPNGTEIGNTIIDVGQGITAYASGYNATADTYVDLVNVNWADTDGLGNLDIFFGTSTNFTATLEGLTNITGSIASYFDDFGLQINPAPLTVDNIKIVDIAGGIGAIEIADGNVDIDVTIRGYAAGYNGTTYVDDFPVTWSVSPGPENATTFPTSGSDWSDFWSGWRDGTVTWTADYGGITDTVDFTINPPQVDYIEIVDSPGTGINLIGNQAVDVGVLITGYAASFNNVIGHLGDIPVNWSVMNASGASAFTNPPNNVDSSVFNSGVTGGQATWTADDGAGHTDSVIIDINPPTVDSIMIVDTEGTGATEIDDQIIDEMFVIQAWAVAINTTIGYLSDVTVTWTLDNASVPTAIIDILSGTNTTFNSGTTEGDVTLIADDGAGHNDTVVFTIDIVYTVDYITIVDTQNTGATEILDLIVDVGFSIAGFVAAFNNSAPDGGYLGDISVSSWDVDAVGTTLPASGLTSTFDAGLDVDGGLATWTADDGAGHTDTVVFIVRAATPDSIRIEDDTGGSGDVVNTASFTVGGSDSYYCVAYNDTVGSIGDKGATWAVTGGIGTVDPATGSFTLFTATTVGPGTVTAEYLGLTDATGTITVTNVTDTTPPDAPIGLVVSQVAAGGALNLAWTANNETDLDGYNVYRSPSATGTFTMLNTAPLTSNTYSDTTVTEGTTYYYYVTAVDDSANESPDSATASNTADRDTDGDNIYNLQDDDDDGDTLTDAEEETLGTNPLLVDTDGDDHNDADDKYPLDASKWKDDDEEGEFPIILLLLPIIIIIILLLLFVMMKKGKPKEEMPPPEMPEEEVPPPEEEVPPPEEEMPPEEEVPPPDEEVPPEEEVPPPEEEMPPEEEVLPPEEEVPPPEEEAPPMEEDVPPPDESAPPTDEPAPPSEDEFPPPP